MIAQRMRHRDVIAVLNEQGEAVQHTPEFVTRLFDEELKRILHELPSGSAEETDRAFHAGAPVQRKNDFDERVQSVVVSATKPPHPRTSSR